MNNFSENDILKFIDPVFRFCLNRLNNYHDAEDLASEIILHVIDGFGKYEIQTLDGWVWKIAHNRYARLINKRNNSPLMVSDDVLTTFTQYDDSFENIIHNEEYNSVFKALHSLTADYRNIAIDYYIGEMNVREIALRYSISETTVKWRLNVSREKIRNRIGDYEMDKIYKRLNWNTTTCNGSMNPDKYLHSQISRAICEASYEKALTIEEISMKTGIPALYIEDEMDSLLYGDAMVKTGNKYATNFIIFRLKDRERLYEHIRTIINECADYYEKLFHDKADKIKGIDFYGSDFDIGRLGYIIVPETIRSLIWNIKDNELKLDDGAYPKRQDGGYGWFIVSESIDESGDVNPYDSGCNHYGDSTGNNEFLYYWIGKTMNRSINHKLRWLRDNDLNLEKLNETELLDMIKHNLIVKEDESYKLNIPCFTKKSHEEFFNLFKVNSNELHDLIKQLIIKVHEAFCMFTPKHLTSQINQYISSFLSGMNSYIIEELNTRGVLAPYKEYLIYNIYYIDRR